ncbi:hypothetical protein DL766_001048 [Monosporascus sp. MC13-8B]|uniref:RanBD1 domain-containing protein n=1 Tax=Monosporascus cannonballus TaxID=155416 RepID=A0ABY0H0U2_9PEZI|nr:hypothetical protein DL762_006862 [Monosporascus cannonballus]RYP00836.1 hypothetical protein DL763_000561 [Monosporascus cannonballus]RYP38339.1 hypothetical protein DL766_001048 [Monosporascus sp. MC13-8B]
MARTTPGPAGPTLNTGFGPEATLAAFVRETIGRKLRAEELKPLEEARDEALRSIDPRHPSPWSFVCELGARHADACHGVLRRVGPELHAALDGLLDELRHEFELGSSGGGGGRYSTVAAVAVGQNPDTAAVPLTPPSASTRGENEGAAKVLRSFEDILSGSPRVAEAAAPSACPSPSPPVNCERDQRGVDPNPSVIGRSASLTVGRSPISMSRPTFQGPTNATNSNNNRPPSPPSADDAAPVTADESQKPKWKKKAINAGAAFRRTIRIGDVKNDECVFRYGDRKGLYVIRCYRELCKKRERPPGSGMGAATEGSSEEDGPIYFREYPFASYASWSHFRVLRHRTTNADQVFGRYAYRVIGATEERNLRKPEPRPDDQPRAKRPFWQRRSCRALSPISVAGEEDKGKQLERAIGVDDGVAASVSAACSHDELKAAFRGLRSAAATRAPAGAGGDGGHPEEQGDVDDGDVTMTGAGDISGTRGRDGDGGGDDAGGENDNDDDNNGYDNDDSDSVGSLPTVEHIVRSARKKRWVDYREKPPVFDEFE